MLASINPWNGIVFEVPQPPLKQIDLLFPPTSADLDRPFIRKLQILFQNGGHDYRIEIPRVVKMGGGDFVIHHQPSNRRAWVELKIGGIVFRAGKDDLQVNPRTCGLTAGLPFDFALFTDAKKSFAILASRSEIPPDWLLGHKEQGNRQSQQSSQLVKPWQNATELRKRMGILLSSPLNNTFVESMVHILDGHRDRNSFNTPGSISISSQALSVEDTVVLEALESEEVHNAGVNGHERKQGYLLRRKCEER